MGGLPISSSVFIFFADFCNSNPSSNLGKHLTNYRDLPEAIDESFFDKLNTAIFFQVFIDLFFEMTK